MAIPALTAYSGPAGLALHGGRWPGGRLLGSLAVAAVVAAGALATSPAVDFFRPTARVLGLQTTDYWVSWTRAVGAVSYSVSVDNGATWLPASAGGWAHITGRTPGATDVVRIRGFDSGGSFSEVSTSVTLPGAGAPTVVVSVVGTGTDPFFGGACDYASPDLWEADLLALAGNTNLVTANVRLECWLLQQEFVNTPCAIEGATGVSATCFRHITAGPGCSLVEMPDRQSAALQINATRGACMRFGSVTSLPTIDLREGYAKCSHIQVKSTGNGSTTWGGWGVHTSSASLPVYVDYMLVLSGTYEFVLSANYGPHFVTNSTFISARPSGASPVANNIGEENNGVVHDNVIFIALGQTPLVMTVARVAATQFTNSALFGATYLHNVLNGGTVGATAGTGAPTYSNAFTDASQAIDISGATVGLPSGVTQVSAASCFVSAAQYDFINYDLRPVAGSPLLAAGVTGCW